MQRRPLQILAVAISIGLFGNMAWCAEKEEEPLLRIEAGGPTSYVTSLAFNADGSALFSGGWDKTVQVWSRETAGDKFRLSSQATYRIPIGPGTGGNINAIALSDDGNFLAVAGRTLIAGETGFRERGIIFPKAGTLTDSMRLDEGVIYLFDTQTREVRTLRGHKGPVVSLAFAPQRAGKPAVLVSVGMEGEEGENRRAVAYLWDVQAAKYLDGHFLVAPRGMRPQIAVWNTGESPRDIRALVALGSQAIVWDVAERKLLPIGDGNNQMIASYLKTKNLLVTSAPGGLQTWTNIKAGETPAKGDLWKLEGAAIPVSVVSFTEASGRNLAAVVLLQPQNSESSLAVFDLADGKLAAGPISLWQERKQPVLTVDQSGSRIAVAGSPDHRILVFSTTDLLAGKNTPQVLQSTGSIVTAAAFVRRGKETGLRLQEDNNAVILDFAKPGLVAADETWANASSAPEDWTATTTATPEGKVNLTLAGPGGLNRQIPLETKQILPVTAFFGGNAQRPKPLAALAVLEEGQPKLWIIEPATGAKLRELTAHSDLITSLSFSEDGRLLVSAARDETVCVWSLTDLDQTLGKLGGLPGVTVEDSGAGLRIASVSLPAFPIPVGAKVLSLVEEGARKPIATALDFYAAFASATPGSTLTFAVEDATGQREVPVRVGQGTDERKPLFSLFIAGNDASGKRRWIGWNPVGPYESSGADAEELLGWHFNTDLPQTPTAFALAKEYRKTYYQENLLRDLIAAGSYEPPAPPPPPSAPQMSLWLREEGKDEPLFGGGGFVRLQKPKGQLHLSVHKFPMERVQSVGLFVDTKAMDGLERISETEWQLDLARIPWGNAIHDLRVVLRTDETPAREFSQEVSAAFQPPPPKIAVKNPAEQTQVRDAKFQLLLDVTPTAGATRIELAQVSEGKVVTKKSLATDKAENFAAEFELRPGSNHFEITAARTEPLKGHEIAEQTKLTYVVSYDEQPTAPPQVQISKVTEGDPNDPSSYSRPAGARIVVMEPKVWIDGSIVGDENLTAAERHLADSQESTPLNGFGADKVKRFEFREQVELRPGDQEIVFTARSARSLTGEARVSVFYQPKLPAVRIEQPTDGKVVSDSTEIDLIGSFDAPAQKVPFQVMVVLNGQVVPRPPILNEKTGKLTARVQLRPGENRLQLRVSNDWNQVTKTSPVTVSYRRLPQIVAVKAPTVSERPLIDIQATVQSPKDSPLTRLEINGHPIPLDGVKLASESDQVATWTIDAKNVPLRSGDNKLEILAWNRDGASEVPNSIQLSYNQQAQPTANVQFISPGLDSVVTTNRYEIAIRVRSESPIVNIDLMNGRQLVYTAPTAVLAKIEVNSTGIYEYSARVPVELNQGANVLELRAINAGGEAVGRRTLSRIEKPIRIVVDRIVTAAGKELESRARADNELEIADAAIENQVRIIGRVIWNDPTREAAIGNLQLRFYANGFQQLPVPLRSVAGKRGERAFMADVSLNRTGQNLIEMDLPSVGEDQATRSKLHVQCAAPSKGQQLHLLIVGFGTADKETLLREAMAALEARKSDQGVYSSSAFEAIHTYGPLTGFVGPEHIITELERIRFNLNVRKSVNDVVMMYYQGSESVSSKGRSYFLTSASKFDPDLDASAITSDDLTSFFDMTPGAHLLCLDVARTQAGQALNSGEAAALVSRWPEESRIGLWRNTWLDGPRVPEDANLLAAIQEAVSSSTTGRLGEVSRNLQGRFEQLSSKYANSFSFYQSIPDQLVDQVVK